MLSASRGCGKDEVRTCETTKSGTMLGVILMRAVSLLEALLSPTVRAPEEGVNTYLRNVRGINDLLQPGKKLLPMMGVR